MVVDILDEKKEEGIDTESIDDILNAEFEDDISGESDEGLEETLGTDVAEVEESEEVKKETEKEDEMDIDDLFGDEKPEVLSKVEEKKEIVKKPKKKVKVDDIESIIGDIPEKPKPSADVDIGLGEELGLGEEIVPEAEKAKVEVEDDFFKEPEKILLYAATKVGKTHAIASLIEAKLNEKPDTKFYVIITDAGFWKTVLRYWRLKKLNTDVLKKQIVYRPILDLNEVFPVLTEIRAQANPDDWIIVDVMSDFWDRAQDKFIESCSTNGNIADLIIEASNDSSKFGTLSGFQWGYCKRLDNTISYYFVINSPCNILATASEKEIGGMAEALSGEDKVEKSVGFMYSAYKEVGYRPDGQKRLPYKFDDICFLGKDQKGKHYFVIVGSRDVDSDFKRIPYGLSFWDAFSGYKKRKMV